MEDNSLSFRESIFLFLMLLTIGACLAFSLALHALAASIPWIIMAIAGGVCLITLTVTRCYLMIEARRRHYLDEPHYDYIEASCREVKRPKGLLRGR